MSEPTGTPSRRTFLKTTTAAAAASMPFGAYAQSGSAEIKVALIGCGGRGTGAAVQSLNVPGTRLVAMADAFEDRLKGSLSSISQKFGDRVDVPQERQFIGFEAYKDAIAAADVVILTTPPGFRPMHFEHAIAQGKHVFMEKPVATDAAGIRQVIAAAKVADEKNLKVVCGLQRRYDPGYLATWEQVQEGLIGDVIASQVYWNGAGVWVKPRKDGQTEMEYQMRNWYYFNWLCGDHIVEQHVHNIDVGNWFKGKVPVKAQGMGGRQRRIGKDFGEIFDHHYVEFVYDDGAYMNSQCRHQPGTKGKVSEVIIGAKGRAYPGRITDNNGKIIWRHKGQRANPYQIEHDVLYKHIRNNEPINNAHYTAEATMTSILGRMATYSGQEISYEDALNKGPNIIPATLAWDADPGPKAGADGIYPCPQPGQSKVI